MQWMMTHGKATCSPGGSGQRGAKEGSTTPRAGRHEPQRELGSPSCSCLPPERGRSRAGTSVSVCPCLGSVLLSGPRQPCPRGSVAAGAWVLRECTPVTESGCFQHLW